MNVETSPAGATREHPVPCALCRRPTLNYSAMCNHCKTRLEELPGGDAA